MPPKNKGESTTRPNHIRFVMLDADISDGNLTELAQAITNALRPQSSHRVPASAPIGQLPAPNGQARTTVAGPQVEEAEFTETTEPEAPITPHKPKTQYSPPQPKYLPDLDPQNEFKEYAAKHQQAKHTKRYLLVALWLRDVKQKPTVNIDQMYSCYKTAGWPTNIKDWDSNFRSLVKQEWLRRESTGEYAINPLGESALQSE
jgi:hypothetical protein